MKKFVLTASLLAGSVLLSTGCALAKKPTKTDWKEGLELVTKTWTNPNATEVVYIQIPDANDSIIIYKDSDEMKVFGDLALVEGIYNRDLAYMTMDMYDFDEDGYDDFFYTDSDGERKFEMVYLYDPSIDTFGYSEAYSLAQEVIEEAPVTARFDGDYYIDGNVNKAHMQLTPAGTVTYYNAEGSIILEGYIEATVEDQYARFNLYDNDGSYFGEILGIPEEPVVSQFFLDDGNRTEQFVESGNLAINIRHGNTFYETLYADLCLAEYKENPYNFYYLYDIDGNGIMELILESTSSKEIFVYTGDDSDGYYRPYNSGWIHPYNPGTVTVNQDGILLFEEYDDNVHTVHMLGMNGLELVDDNYSYVDDSYGFEGEPVGGASLDDLQVLINHDR
ncbi:MAG: hypothetical protein K5776_10450 [Lachnospiraceae bacterium]|nr:hypothetical protein [Lachnospiraceae bacterium]